MKKIKSFALVFILIAAAFIFTLNASAKTDSVDFENAIKETAYSFYMRGKNIQYNTNKGNPSFYNCPEDITAQNRGYLVCSAFTRNVYYDIFGIKVPMTTANLLKYSADNFGNPEVIAYGKTSNGVLTMKFSENGKITEKQNPTTDEFLQHLKCGDIITYTGHTMLVYDLIYDGTKVIDAYIIESNTGTGKRISSKLFAKITMPNGQVLGSGSAYHLYYNSRINNGFEEGSLHLSTIKNVSVWSNLQSKKLDEYSILRFVTVSGDNLILNYQGKEYNDRNHKNEIVTVSEKTKGRIKFSKLYIEKTVDKFNLSVVNPETELTYKITVKNNSKSDYTENITVSEILSDSVDYKNEAAPKSLSFKKSGDVLNWNLGKLKSGAEISVFYTVKVKKNTVGKIISNTGSVMNIPTSKVQNKVGIILNEKEKTSVSDSFNSLKDKYSGRELIEKIYAKAFGKTLGIASFNIDDLVINANPSSSQAETLSLNEENSFTNAVLGNYYGALCSKGYGYNGESIIDYDMKNWEEIGILRRADTVYEQHFMTGDVLIYRNKNDVSYSLSGGILKKSTVTNENGEYAFIYIEGKGFVGVNIGNDKTKGTKDDRNSFTYSYYADNNLQVHNAIETIDKSEYEFLNLQTLFVKDSFVIL